MGNKNYQAGRGFEYRILNKLKEQGYDGIRSAGSHSPVDLLVWKTYIAQYHNTTWILDPELYMIQCKHSEQKDVNFTSLLKEDNVIKLAAMPDNFIKVLCIKQPRSRTIIQLVYDKPTWKFRKVFDI